MLKHPGGPRSRLTPKGYNMTGVWVGALERSDNHISVEGRGVEDGMKTFDAAYGKWLDEMEDQIEKSDKGKEAETGQKD